MSGYITNIEEETIKNENFRKVLFTASHSQLVVMSLKPKEEIGEEIHQLDQFIRIEAGQGQAVLDGEVTEIKDDSAVVVPAGANHNIINTSTDNPLKLYSIYSPPEHKDGTVHQTKEEAEADEHDHHDQ
ncbi:cupin domain-containing protein [Patescibacteria group bacterium]